MRPADLVTDLLDLVLGRACLECDRLGPVLCDGCLGRLRGRVVSVPHPVVARAAAALPYDEGGPLVLAYKERRLLSLAPMLGVLLADAVADQLEWLDADRVVIVPVPSHPRPARGFDAVGRLVSHARRHLRDRGVEVTVADDVIAARRHRPLKALSREDRLREAQGAFGLRSRRTVPAAGPVLVVDDVLTTGATTTAVVRALADAGVGVHGIAAVAAVTREVVRGRQPG